MVIQPASYHATPLLTSPIYNSTITLYISGTA